MFQVTSQIDSSLRGVKISNLEPKVNAIIFQSENICFWKIHEIRQKLSKFESEKSVFSSFEVKKAEFWV